MGLRRRVKRLEDDLYSLRCRLKRICTHRHESITDAGQGWLHFECPDCGRYVGLQYADLSTSQRAIALQQGYVIPEAK